MKTEALRTFMLASFGLSFLGGTFLVAVAVCINFNLPHIVGSYIDLAIKRSNYTRTFLHRYGSIVPNKDFMPAEVNLGHWLTFLPFKAFDFGVLISVFSIFGIYTVRSRKIYLHYVLIGLLIFSIFGHFIFANSLGDIRSMLHHRVRRQLAKNLRESYQFGAETNDTFTFLLNTVMLMGECCGINGPHDFTHTRNTYTHVGGGPNHSVTHHATLIYPLACCRKNYLDDGFLKTMDCALSWSKEAINERGCYTTAFEYITERCGSVVLGLVVVVTHCQLLQVIGAFFLASAYKAEKQRMLLASARNELAYAVVASSQEASRESNV